MEKGAKVVLHISPIGASVQRLVLGSEIADKLRGPLVSPIYETGYNPGYNFDGIFSYPPGGTSGLVDAYLQLSRSGCLETVNRRVLQHKLIPGETFERGVIEALPRYFEALEILDIAPPVFVMLSFVGVSGFPIAAPNSGYTKPIDRDTLVCQEVLIENFTSNVAAEMKTAIDMVWNAVGWAESPNYRGNKWIPDRR
jgi:hypothetical protein